MSELIEKLGEELFFPFQKELRESSCNSLDSSFVDAGFQRAFYQSARTLQEYVTDSDILLSSYIEESAKGSYLVFMNGELRLDLSDVSRLPKALVILPTSKALKTYGPVLLSRYKEQKQDPFALLNLAYFKEGVVIYVPAKLAIENPLQILFLTSSNNLNSIAFPRIDLVLGKESSLDLLLSSPSALVDSPHLSIASLEASLEERAELSLCDFVTAKAGSIHFCDFRLRKEAKVSMRSVNFSSLVHGLHCKAELAGERAQFEIKGISTLHPYAQTSVKVFLEHKAKETESHQHFKQILSAGSKSVFEGKIYVHPEALLTNAYQRSNALLLSDHAYAICKPNLEIFADDVKASHGATVATLREEEEHYLRTRGLPSEEARGLLIEGFVKEIISDIPYGDVHRELPLSLQNLYCTLSQV